jgi:peroxiredoxin Q/BCP
MVEEGRSAPDFSLPDADGVSRGPKDFRGKKFVLYFYPKDNTSGCTKEACGFRDAYARILAKGALVVGVSPDGTASHRRFRDKYGLPFVLLSDPERSVIESYGAFGEKKMYGKTVKGVIRSTFVIDERGRVVKVFPKVSPEGHAEEILALL